MPEASETETLRVEHADATTTIVFDDASNGNKIGVPAMRALIDGISAATERESLLLILRGANGDFTTGRDQSTPPPAGMTRKDSLNMILEANDALAAFTGISIAAVEGRALGFGSGFAMQADLTIADAEAVFGFDEVLHRLSPLVVAEYLVGYIGPKAAQDLVLTGRSVATEEALRLGMITRIAPAGELDDALTELTSHLLSLEAGALRLMKRYFTGMRLGTLNDRRAQAVSWLDQWIAEDRPAIPSGE